MKITTKGRYAVTAILDIAINSHQKQERAVTLAEISARQNISLPYLEQLFAKLRKHGIVNSIRGPNGGYKLNLPMEKLSVGMIIEAVNENINATQCMGNGNCKGGAPCITHALWDELSQRIEDFLYEITVASLVEKHQQPCH